MGSVRAYLLTGAPGVPAPVAPYAHATEAAGLLHVTGQLPIDPTTSTLVAGGIQAQTDQVLRNLSAVLAACGASLDDAVMARAYLVSMDLYEDFNLAYARWFPTRLPSRTTVAVAGLALGALVEIDLVCLAPAGPRADRPA